MQLVIDHARRTCCAGPCASVAPEPPPQAPGWHAFKPRDGGRYAELVYPRLDGSDVVVTNARVCPGCAARLLELEEAGAWAQLDADACAVASKLAGDDA